jgi:short-subunit dehydrogenase
MDRQLKHERLRLLTLDLSKPSDAAVITPEFLGPFEVVINNAGGTTFGRFEDLNPAQVQAIISLTLVASLLITRAFLKAARPGSVLVNVPSQDSSRCPITCSTRPARRLWVRYPRP